MPENNQMMSIEGQLCGMPLAGPESFSQQQLDYLKRALGVDETVLYYNSDGYKPGTGVAPSDVYVQLAESIMNFERIRISIGGKLGEVVEMLPSEATTSDDAYNHSLYISRPDRVDNTSTVGLLITIVENNSTQLRFRSGYSGNWADAYRSGQDWGYYTLYKIVGIHRIAGGNT